jgi:hypothetical protein
MAQQNAATVPQSNSDVDEQSAARYDSTTTFQRFLKPEVKKVIIHQRTVS